MKNAMRIGMGLSLMAGVAFAAPTPQQKCQADENTLAGKYAACRLQVEGKHILNADQTRYDIGMNKCLTRLEDRWLKAQPKDGGTCSLGATASEVDAMTRIHVDVIARRIADGPRFYDNADGTVVDTRTGLQWEKKVLFDDGPDLNNLNDADNVYLWSNRCSLLSSKLCQPDLEASAACLAGVEGDPTGCLTCGPGEGDCSHFSGYVTIWEWLVQLNVANFAEHDDWRIPKRLELESLLDLTDATPPATFAAFHAMSCGDGCSDITDPDCSCTNPFEHWCATSLAGEPAVGWIVQFDYGDVHYDSKVNDWYVRAVRSR